MFYADYAKPEGFCDEAWKAICSCNDGLRPVIFKLEATDEIMEAYEIFEQKREHVIKFAVRM